MTMLNYVQSVRLFRVYITQMLSPLANCSVNDTLIKAAPFINLSFFQMVDVTNL